MLYHHMTANSSVPSPSPFGPWFGSDSSSDAKDDFDLILPPPTTSDANPSQTIEALLQSGREELGVDLGFLARIDPGPGTHTVTVSSGSHRTLSEGTVHDLARTYCRTVVVASSPLALHDAPNQGWADDPAYERFGLDTYLGTKIVVDDHLYGTVCFADASPRSAPFSETDRDVLKRLASSIEDVLPPADEMGADIDRRKRQKEELRLFRTAVEDANEAILFLEGTPRSKPGPPIAYANPAFTDLSGYDAEEITGQPLEFLWGPDTNEHVLRDFWNALEAGCRHEGETIAYRKDGTPFINRWSIAPVRNTEQSITHWISVQRDVTAQRETDKRLLEIQDEERRRIDQELHDELGGLLTSLQLTVELARMDTDADSVSIDYLDEIEKQVDDVASATRTISRRLHPDVLNEDGLSCAVPALLQSLQEKHGVEIRCTCEVDSNATLASSVEMVAYQVVQEALLSAVHQFSASALSVTIRTEERQLCADVLCRDALLPDRAGEATDCKRLRRMSEWVHRFDGEFTVSYEAETDTRIRATFPLTVAPLPD